MASLRKKISQFKIVCYNKHKQRKDNMDKETFDTKVKEIGEMAKKYGVLFHTDAVQAFGQMPINVDEMNIDMLSGSGHKLNGPKGVGFLYIRTGIKNRSFVHGGQQERARRAEERAKDNADVVSVDIEAYAAQNQDEE